MIVGNLKQKASPRMVIFVFACILMVVFLLHAKQVATAKALDLADISAYDY